jgi:hypothetical protein
MIALADSLSSTASRFQRHTFSPFSGNFVLALKSIILYIYQVFEPNLKNELHCVTVARLVFLFELTCQAVA